MTASPVTTTVPAMPRTPALNLVGTSDVAALAGVSRRTVEWWIDRGWLTPAAVVGARNLWTRTYINQWLKHPRPAARRPDPDWAPYKTPDPLDLLGLDEIAAHYGITVASARWKVSAGHLPAPAAKVSGALVWTRASLEAAA